MRTALGKRKEVKVEEAQSFSQSGSRAPTRPIGFLREREEAERQPQVQEGAASRRLLLKVVSDVTARPGGGIRHGVDGGGSRAPPAGGCEK